MTTEKALDFYNGLPAWAKGVLVVGTGVVIYFAAKGIIQRIKKDATSRDSNKAVSDAATDLNRLLSAGQKLTYSQSQYDSFAQKIFSAVNGYGTAETQIYDVFNQMKNKVDVLKLIVTFGVRTVPSGQWNPEPDATGDLSFILVDELLQSELDAVNQILKNKNIDYKF